MEIYEMGHPNEQWRFRIGSHTLNKVFTIYITCIIQKHLQAKNRIEYTTPTLNTKRSQHIYFLRLIIGLTRERYNKHWHIQREDDDTNSF